MIGTLLNQRYRIDTKLGRGGMGVVYRAHDTLLERDVAVKVMSATALGTAGRARLMHEARAVAKLNHPNIVSVYDAGETEMVAHAGTAPFIVMELVQGDTLHDRRPEELGEIISFARQICAALEHAHAHGIIHRDIKPENVMILPDGSAKLMDFGLARSVASRLTTEGTLIGTVFYLAPEQAMGGEIDHRADLYALGVMLYELTTGGLPFTADDPFAVITQHLHAPVVPPRAKSPEIPLALNTLIVQLLSKAPKDRPASAAKVREVLERLESGKEESIAAPEVTEEPSVLDRIVRGRLVGRERELAEARELWKKAVSGKGQMLLVSGEPGIGKTRLVRELATQVEVSGGRAFVGACYAEGGVPYAPVAQILRRALQNGSGDDVDWPEFVLADLLTLAPALRLRYPDVKPNPVLDDPRAKQHRLFENLVIFCTALSEQAPLLLVLEDTHWADSGTLFLLRHLARHTRHQRVMIVATYREVELDEARPFHEVLLDINRERLATRLKLTRLERVQTREMLGVLFAEEITPEFLEGIYRETEGNPFFVEEVCKALVESGKLYYEDGRWHRPGIAELGIPQSVRVAIQSRVRVLPAKAQKTLRLAAVLGRTFDFDTLAAASDQDEDTLIDGLESAERAQLIEEVSGEGGGTFAFVHALFPSTLVEGLRTLQRRRLHRRAAAAVEANRPDDFEALAHHYNQAAQGEKAAEYLLKAGDRARGLYAHQEAIDSYQQALDFLRDAGNLERAARTLMKLGLTYHNAFDFRQARQAYEEGFALWQRAGEVPGGTPLPPAPHGLRLMQGDPPTLDPTVADDDASGSLIEQLFSGLVELDPQTDVVPDIARSWEVSEGGHKYVFHLRDDVRWSDGMLLTAADFEYAWKRVLDPVTASPSANLLYDIKGARSFHQGESGRDDVGVQAWDDVTLVVELEEPTSYLFQLLTHTTCYPVPQHVVEAHGEAWTETGNLVTNGPFKLEVWQRGESMAFSRNPEYHGRFTGNVQRVELSLRRDGPSARLEMYEAGRLDVVSFPPLEMDRARQRHAGEYISFPILHTLYLGFDMSRPPFDNSLVRRAFVLATDRERLADVVLRGYPSPATGGFVPPGMPGHSPEIGLPYDPGQARQLLAEAGYPGGAGFPGIGSLVRRGTASGLVPEYLQTQWRENLGIETKWEAIEWAVLLDRSRNDPPHMFTMGWIADYPDPDNFLRVGFFRKALGWRNETFDRLMEEARRVTDQGERLKLYGQADRILVEEAAIMPLTHGRAALLVQPWVSKLPISAIGRRFWKDIIIESH